MRWPQAPHDCQRRAPSRAPHRHSSRTPPCRAESDPGVADSAWVRSLAASCTQRKPSAIGTVGIVIELRDLEPADGNEAVAERRGVGIDESLELVYTHGLDAID